MLTNYFFIWGGYPLLYNLLYCFFLFSYVMVQLHFDMFKYTRRLTFFKIIIDISKYKIGNEITFNLNELCRNISILASFFYTQSFHKVNNFIRTSFSKSKTIIKTLFWYLQYWGDFPNSQDPL